MERLPSLRQPWADIEGLRLRGGSSFADKLAADNILPNCTYPRGIRRFCLHLFLT